MRTRTGANRRLFFDSLGITLLETAANIVVPDQLRTLSFDCGSTRRLLTLIPALSHHPINFSDS